VVENRVLTKLLGPNGEDITGDFHIAWRRATWSVIWTQKRHNLEDLCLDWMIILKWIF